LARAFCQSGSWKKQFGISYTVEISNQIACGCWNGTYTDNDPNSMALATCPDHSTMVSGGYKLISYDFVQGLPSSPSPEINYPYGNGWKVGIGCGANLGTCFKAFAVCMK